MLSFRVAGLLRCDEREEFGFLDASLNLRPSFARQGLIDGIDPRLDSILKKMICEVLDQILIWRWITYEDVVDHRHTFKGRSRRRMADWPECFHRHECSHFPALNQPITNWPNR